MAAECRMHVETREELAAAAPRAKCAPSIRLVSISSIWISLNLLLFTLFSRAHASIIPSTIKSWHAN